MFEGGTRSAAFVHSPLLPPRTAGQTYEGLLHVSDWFVTFAVRAGVAQRDIDQTGPVPPDGIDAWPVLSALGSGDNLAEGPLVRQEALLCGNSSWRVGEADKLDGSLVVMHNASFHFKLIVAQVRSMMWFDLNNSGWKPLPPAAYERAPDDAMCRPYCLFDLQTDPAERTNLHATRPELLDYLLARYAALTATQVPAEAVCDNCTGAEACAATTLGKNKGHWGPFREN